MTDAMPETSSPRPRSVLPALILVTMTATLDTSISNVALPVMSSEFGVTVAAAQWVTLGFLLTTTVLILPVGRLADLVGRRRLLLIGLALFGLSSLTAVVAPTLPVLVASRALQGVGAAAMTALPVSLVRQNVEPTRVGRTMGLLGSSMAAGFTLGPAVGGLLLAGPGWRASYLVIAALAGVGTMLVMRRLPADAERERGLVQRRRTDLVGLTVMAVGLLAYTVAVTLQPGGGTGVAVLGAVTVASFLLFLRVERRAEQPVVDLELVARARVVPAMSLAFLVSTVMSTFTVVGPFYLSGALAMPSGLMGVTMAVGPFVAVLSGAPAGRLVDRFGPQRVARVGIALLIVSSAVMVLTPSALGVVGFLLGAVLLTPGNQLFMAANNTSATARAGEHQAAVSGIVTLGRNLGLVTGTALAAVLFQRGVDGVEGPAGSVLGLQIAFGFAGVVAVVALVLAWRAVRVVRPEPFDDARAAALEDA